MGSTTELPERLHIDYAKTAYRASNRRQFFSQMTTWLRRQEAIHRFNKFLDWRQGITVARINGPAVVLEDRDGRDNEVHFDQDIKDALATEGADVRSYLPFLFGPFEDASHYALAKTPPFPNFTISTTIEKHKAPFLVERLRDFLRNNVPDCQRIPQGRDILAVCKQAKVLLQSVLQVSDKKRENTIRAIPEEPRSPGRAGSPEKFDSALIRRPVANDGAAGTPLEGTSKEHYLVRRRR